MIFESSELAASALGFNHADLRWKTTFLTFALGVERQLLPSPFQ